MVMFQEVKESKADILRNLAAICYLKFWWKLLFWINLMYCLQLVMYWI